MELIKAFGLGTLAQSSLLLAGLFACWVKVPTRIVGMLAGFGAGAMISAIAFDLVPEARVHIELWETVPWMLFGVAIFLLGDALVDKRFGSAFPERSEVASAPGGSLFRPRLDQHVMPSGIQGHHW